MLRASDLHVNYAQAEALRGPSLSLDEHDMVILLGRNGAGKSTLLNTISGLLSPSAGDITWDGESIVGVAPHDLVPRGIVQVSEGRRVFPKLSVRDNLLSGGTWLSRGRRQELEELTAEMFPWMKERAGQAAGNLSGGERQMLLIARALMLDPRLLLLDEPSQGLAPVAFDLVLEKVREISKLGVAVLMVEQNTRVLDLHGRVLVLDWGRLVVEAHSSDEGILERVRAAYFDGLPQEGAT